MNSGDIARPHHEPNSSGAPTKNSTVPKHSDR
jgi:hypothetical protein